VTAEIFVKGEYQGPGEKKTVETLGRDLPDGWIIFANRKLPGEQRADLDIVVVGYSCVFVLEEKAWGPEVVLGDQSWKTSRREYRNPVDRVAHLSRVLAGLLKVRVENYSDAVRRRHLVIPAVVLSHDDLILIRQERHDSSELVLELRDQKCVNELVDRDARNEELPGNVRKSLIDFLAGTDEQGKKTKKIGEYQVISELAPVGQAKAFHAQIDRRDVVLRCYPLNGYGPGKVMPNKLKREAEALARLEEFDLAQHALPSFDDEVNQWYVTPLLIPKNSRSLLYIAVKKEYEDDSGKLFPEIIEQIISNSFNTLSGIHDEKVLHRAIHPSRILIGRQLKIKFKDFFFAKVDESSNSTILFSEDDADCSVSYRAPECKVNSQLATEKSDVYSLALSLASWITGKISDAPDVEELKNELLALEIPSAKHLVACLNEESSLRPSASDALVAFSASSKEIEYQPSNLPIMSETPQQPNFDVGALVHDRYEIVESLGSGGFATTWRANDKERGIEVVLKVFRENVPFKSAANEFHAAKNVLSHRCARVWDISNNPSPGFLVCEFVPGIDLGRFGLRENVDARSYKQIALDVFEGLSDVHSSGLTHRDLSPSNIIVDDSENTRAKIIDFGLSAREEDRSKGGTLRFSAPECLAGKPGTIKSDLYSAAAAILTAMLGRLPYSEGPDRVLIFPNDAEAQTWGGLGNALIRTLYTALEKDSELRPSTAKAFRDELMLVDDIQELVGLSDEINSAVDSIRNLYRGSEIGNSDNRGLDDSFAHLTYVQTALDKHLISRIVDGSIKILLLTGNPGDGKTSFLVKVRDALKNEGAQLISNPEDKTKWILSHKGKTITAILDASEGDEQQDSDGKLDEAIRPVIFGKGDHVALVAINDGRLIKYFKDRSFDFGEEVSRDFISQARGDDPRREDFVVVDLKKRSLVSQSISDNLTIKILNSLVDKDLWKTCNRCASKDICPIFYNVQELQTGVSIGISELVRVSHLRRRRRATLRDLRSALSWVIAGNRSCKDVHAARELGQNLKLGKDALYFDLAFSKNSSDYLIQEWSEIDPAEVSSSILVRNARENGLLDQNSIISISEQISAIKRRQFFKSSGSDGEIHGDLLAYEHIEKFTELLFRPSAEVLDLLLLGISKIVGAPGFAGDGLAIASNEKNSDWTILKIVPSSNFDIVSFQQLNVLMETYPDSAYLRHKDGAQLAITLDTAEIIFRAANGEILDDPYSESIRKEIEGFTLQVRRQPAMEVSVVDPSGSVVKAKQTDGRIELVSIY
jgi:serine/threonine protein kinase